LHTGLMDVFIVGCGRMYDTYFQATADVYKINNVYKSLFDSVYD